MASQTLPVITGDKDRSLQEVLSRLTGSRAPLGPGRGPDRHRGAPAAGGRGLVRAVPRGDRRAAARRRWRPAASSSSTRIRPKPSSTCSRPQRRHDHADGVGQDALLQRAGAERDPAGPVDARALPVSDQGARAGSARRAACAVGSSLRTAPMRRDRRVHLRRRHAAGRAARDPRQGARRAEQSRHAALGDPAAPSALGEAVREPAVRRHRRAARLSRRVRQPPRRTSCGGCSASAGTTARIRCSSARRRRSPIRASWPKG